MIELKDYQREAVNKLKVEVIDLLNLSESRQKLIFKAPTGAGKTVMASTLLDELTDEVREGKCKYTDVAYIWIAPNKLHQQSYLSMRNFFTETRRLHPVMFDEVNPSEGLQPGDVLFVNWESINKDNAVMIRDNEQNRTLYRLTGVTQFEKQIPIIAVIDEEHMFGGRLAKKSELVLQNIRPKVEIRISATPITPGPTVAVPREKVVAEEMIKKSIALNPNMPNTLEDRSLKADQKLLKIALQKRDDLARAYKQYGINPLLLIQLPNDSSDSLNTEEKTIVEDVTSYLAAYKNISVENENMAIWLSGDKQNLEGIERFDSKVDVLLFKQAIALGWDCPRAAVLLIFRELNSFTFTTQVVGRIMRMPEQHFYTNDALNYGYVYTNLSEDMIEVTKDEMNYISKIFSKIRPNLNNIMLPSVYQYDRKTRNRLGSDFKDILFKTIEQSWQSNAIGEIFSAEDFLSEDDKEDLAMAPKDIESRLLHNLEMARLQGLQMDVTGIRIPIPRDVKLSGEEGVTEVTSKARIALTEQEISTLFVKFCSKNTGGFAAHDSTPVLYNALLDMMEKFYGKNEFDAARIIMWYRNKPKFQALIKQALEAYAKHLALKESKRAQYVYKNNEWLVPETRMFNTEFYHSCEDTIFNHAMKPFFELNRVSMPEHKFARWVDSQTEVVEWWYKNGDSGSENFAIPYTDHQGTPRCFYVDFVIRLKNQMVCLLDTKTMGSDEDAPEKHNALLKYIDEQNAKGMHLMGGIVIQDENSTNWYYPSLPIKDTDSLKGWDVLDLRQLNSKLF